MILIFYNNLLARDPINNQLFIREQRLGKYFTCYLLISFVVRQTPLCPAEAGHLPQGGENTVLFI
jgi:hypothetical protein